jgi:hypothetical protein
VALAGRWCGAVQALKERGLGWLLSFDCTAAHMEAPLKSLCIACARYAEGDQLGKALAALATSPYFVIYHCAVLLHARRELHVAFVLIGLLLMSGARADVAA